MLFRFCLRLFFLFSFVRGLNLPSIIFSLCKFHRFVSGNWVDVRLWCCACGAGFRYLRSKLPEVVDNVTEKLPPNVLHELLFCIRTHFNLTISQKKSLLLALQRLYPEADSVPSLRPLLFSFEDLGTKRCVWMGNGMAFFLQKSQMVAGCMTRVAYLVPRWRSSCCSRAAAPTFPPSPVIHHLPQARCQSRGSITRRVDSCGRFHSRFGLFHHGFGRSVSCGLGSMYSIVGRGGGTAHRHDGIHLHGAVFGGEAQGFASAPIGLAVPKR